MDMHQRRHGAAEHAGAGRRSRGRQATNAKKAELDQNEFLTLMITQLKNQDPTKPMDPAQFLGQLAQFSPVSGLADINRTSPR